MGLTAQARAHMCTQSHDLLTVPAGQPDDAEVTWRSLYACNNGWRGLQPGCFEMLDLPSTSEGHPPHSWGQGWPYHCILDSQDLGWSALPEGASELLVIVEWTSVLVSLATYALNFLVLPVSAACPQRTKFRCCAGI